MASSPFCDFFSLGAGVTPAQGSVKPTVGFTLNEMIYLSAAQAIILTHQLSMYGYFFPLLASGAALDLTPAAIHLRESAGSITSSTPKCDALLIAFPR